MYVSRSSLNGIPNGVGGYKYQTPTYDQSNTRNIKRGDKLDKRLKLWYKNVVVISLTIQFLTTI